MDKDRKNEVIKETQEERLQEEIEQARKEGKSEAWIRMNLDI